MEKNHIRKFWSWLQLWKQQYQKALELATAMETAAQVTQDMNHVSGFSPTTNQVIHWNISKDRRGKYSHSRKVDHPSVPVIGMKVNKLMSAASSKKQNFFIVRSEDILQRYAKPSKEEKFITNTSLGY